MVTHMKTTIYIADEIFRSTQKLCAKEKTTFRSLVEEGLMLALEKHDRSKKVSLQPVVFRGKGLSKEFQGLSWESIRDASYKGRGA